tara:strand:- start:181 stop:1332 length:1152 start_codon:yes stop_codon:yes gene_type:complete
MYKLIKDYFLVIFLSTIFSIYLFEIFLNIQINKHTNIELKKKLLLKNNNQIFDTRTQSEYYYFIKKKNNNLNVSISCYPFDFLKDNSKLQPLSGVSSSLTINCNENGYFNTYISDRYGFNNPDDEWGSDEIEYLLVGDSFTHGACVNRPDDIASILRKLSTKNVLNLGYGSNGPLLEYVTLREYIKPNVKKILWMYFEGNDQADLNIEINNKLLNNYLINENYTQNLISRQSEIDELVKDKFPKILDYRNEMIEKDNLKYKILKFIRLDKTKKKFRNKKNKFQKDKFLDIIKKADTLAKKNNSEFYFVYLPSYSRYDKILRINDYKNYKFIKNSINNLNIPFIDLHKNIFYEDPKSLFPFGLSGHYNKKGYQDVAKYIFEFTK